jgi:IS605 OrfB family transposase
METVRTIACKLAPTPEQRAEIDATLVAFADACNFIADVARRQHTSNKVKIQHACYTDVRARFGLSANLAIRAIARVCAALKVKSKAHSTFEPTSIDYDQRIFSFREWDWTFSLTLLHARARLDTVLGKRQQERLKGQTPSSATLVKRRDGTCFLHVQIKGTAPIPQNTTGVLGVDLGRTDIAHTSDDHDWSGQELTAVRDRYSRLRAALQHKASKGTRSTRRRCRELLARLSGREARFQRHTNHEISKDLIGNALQSGRALALEDLTGIRERTNTQPRKKTERRRSNSWAFYQLRQFVAYKAEEAGVVLHLVPAAYTSQMCHRCLHIGSRQGKRFRCTNPRCLWTGDADYNGAQNIKILGEQVSLPRGPWVHSAWSEEPNGLLESSAQIA